MISKEILVGIFRVGKIVSDAHSLIRAGKYPHQNFTILKRRLGKSRRAAPSWNPTQTELTSLKVKFIFLQL